MKSERMKPFVTLRYPFMQQYRMVKCQPWVCVCVCLWHSVNSFGCVFGVYSLCMSVSTGSTLPRQSPQVQNGPSPEDLEMQRRWITWPRFSYGCLYHTIITHTLSIICIYSQIISTCCNPMEYLSGTSCDCHALIHSNSQVTLFL